MFALRLVAEGSLRLKAYSFGVLYLIYFFRMCLTILLRTETRLSTKGTNLCFYLGHFICEVKSPKVISLHFEKSIFMVCNHWYWHFTSQCLCPSTFPRVLQFYKLLFYVVSFFGYILHSAFYSKSYISTFVLNPFVSWLYLFTWIIYLFTWG